MPFPAVCRFLINEINANHEARTPEGLARNVVLIKELNSNVSKVKYFPFVLAITCNAAGQPTSYMCRL